MFFRFSNHIKDKCRLGQSFYRFIQDAAFYLFLLVILSGCKSLHHSSSVGDLPAVKQFVENKSTDINKKNLNGKTPLIIAAENGHLDIVNYLVSNNSNLFINDNMNLSPISWSILNDHNDVTNALLDSVEDYLTDEVADDVYGDALFSLAQAIYSAGSVGNMDLVRNLLARHKSLVNYSDKNGATPLFGPVLVGRAGIVEFIIENGADPTILSKKTGYTPLHLASLAPVPGSHGHYYFVVNNFSLFSKHMLKKLLSHATSDGYIDTIKSLINQGADVNAKSRRGETPLHLASIGADISVIRLLLNNGADVNARDIYGHTPSWFAGLHHREDVEALYESYGGTWD